MKLCTLLILAGITFLCLAAATPETDEKAKVAILTTQAFESGELKMDEVSALSLEALLQDLNRRKDYDYSQHDGQPGPDSAYLWKWVQKVTAELERRGYYFDKEGNLHRPGVIVPLR